MTELISVQVIGDKEFVSYLDRLGPKINPAMKQTMAEAAKQVTNTAKEKYLNLKSPGPGGLRVVSSRLWSAVLFVVKGEGVNIIGQIGVGTKVPYARIWEKGGTIRAHKILPKKGKFLKFTVGGKDVFARSVSKKARYVTARPFLTPALRDKKTDVFKLFDEAISKLIGGIGV